MNSAPGTVDFDGRATGMSRRDFLAASFLTGATAALFAGPTGAVEPPRPRARMTVVFEDDVFEKGVFL